MLDGALNRLRAETGVPLVAGGIVRHGSGGELLVLDRTLGSLDDALNGARVRPGRGLGGAVLAARAPCSVDDYITDGTITHEFAERVVRERLTSTFAHPVVVDGRIRAVLYGAARDGCPLGDRALDGARRVSNELALVLGAAPATHHRRPWTPAEALRELARAAAEVRDPVLRGRLEGIHRCLVEEPPAPADPGTAVLAPREVDVLRRVAVGRSNQQVADDLGLSPLTVKAYLRSAMRKLGVSNRTAAVHAARTGGVLT
ncbi:helix-turn-helix transcriptional regulator [Pseudonocardia halophobica]|uniref:Helix-turn-helix transcriptional regulator n=1 Tax=Pseudonocardia halophobica TaxID=29401 RepID=A0A9W6P0C8_9PSEU|nr:LuxR C-terminal-related transcriptional regulator [Pseudonocardia halophobica]GLL15524.1 helix-turn-helix transcriptional regulator [Pseudonocardia halophobica]